MDDFAKRKWSLAVSLPFCHFQLKCAKTPAPEGANFSRDESLVHPFCHSCSGIFESNHPTRRIGMVALPFCRVRLQGEKPPDRAYPREIGHIGDAIRAGRLGLGLLQKDVARIIGCNELTVVNWEKCHTSPRITKMARIEGFLKDS